MTRPPPKPVFSLQQKGESGAVLVSPAPRSQQAGRGWSLLGLYKACKLTLCSEPVEGAPRGSGLEGEGREAAGAWSSHSGKGRGCRKPRQDPWTLVGTGQGCGP